MAKLERSAILKKFRAMAARGEPIVGGGAGTGLSAKCEEAGGVDLIVIGSHPIHGVERVVGTVASRVVNHADRSVLVVRERDVAALRRG